MQQIIDMEYIKALKELYWIDEAARYEAAKEHVKTEARTPKDYEIGIRIICEILEY